jgi:membrane protein
MFLPREVRMFAGIWRMLKQTVLAFIEDEALSRGAAIAFYTVTSIAPVLLIVIAIAGLAFGQGFGGRTLAVNLKTATAPTSRCRLRSVSGAARRVGTQTGCYLPPLTGF